MTSKGIINKKKITSLLLNMTEGLMSFGSSNIDTLRNICEGEDTLQLEGGKY